MPARLAQQRIGALAIHLRKRRSERNTTCITAMDKTDAAFDAPVAMAAIPALKLNITDAIYKGKVGFTRGGELANCNDQQKDEDQSSCHFAQISHPHSKSLTR